MLVMTCCQSNKGPEVKTVYVIPELYFPKYPQPKNNLLPLDENGKVVKDDETEIVNVLIPFWYYKLLVEYKVQVDEAQAKYEAYKSNLNK